MRCLGNSVNKGACDRKRQREVAVGHKWSQTRVQGQRRREESRLQGITKSCGVRRHKTSIAVSFLPIALTEKQNMSAVSAPAG